MERYIEIDDPKKLTTARLVNKGLPLAKIITIDDIENVIDENCKHFKTIVMQNLRGDVDTIRQLKRIEIILAKVSDKDGDCEVLILDLLGNGMVFIKLVPIKKLRWFEKYAAKN